MWLSEYWFLIFFADKLTFAKTRSGLFYYASLSVTRIRVWVGGNLQEVLLLCEFAIKILFCDSAVVHSDDMSKPSEALLTNNICEVVYIGLM